MDLLKFVITRGRNEVYMIPFPYSANLSGFHISFHNPEYGIHLKVTKPKEIQSVPIKYEEIIATIQKTYPVMAKRIFRLPKKGHSYLLVIPSINTSALPIRSTRSQTIVRINNKMLSGYRIEERPETSFIPKDFKTISSVTDINYVFAVVPYTGEITYFRPLDEGAAEKIADVSEELEYDILKRMNGLLFTFTYNDAQIFLECFPNIADIVGSFFQEVEKAGIRLYDCRSLEELFKNIFSGLPSQ